MLTQVNWERVGSVVSAVGSPMFGRELYKLVNDTFLVDEVTIFSFTETIESLQSPQEIIVESYCDRRQESARDLARAYISGDYKIDPNIRNKISDDFLSVYVTSPDNLIDDTYRSRYYESIKITSELIMLGRCDGYLYYISFYRAGSQSGFGEHEIEAVKSMADFMLKTLLLHKKLARCGRHVSQNSSVEQHSLSINLARAHMREVLLSDPSRLSPREAEVCASIMLGYSTIAISMNCQIASNTVATHRKRAYAKLGISSQNELFSRYFKTVNAFLQCQGGCSMLQAPH
ncbi:helix-turn-helix transcriptional regulator [Acetobacter senegalensis]|uniref:helix-turn-helix transcriptional regulator n=1 Tax=Acetobacter senegalensis TaxID=446692 RepID=UPI001EDAF8DC|nr:helix-turn-helix transcriptional regulator [Acetobacter senegalensis]MCG4262438.1 helix-turn-helix transcriptional regulator [Acetobacter senegalensis]